MALGYVVRCICTFVFLEKVANKSQILCHSTDKNYFLTNLPWLIGSLGTMAEDVMIFVQFRLYAVRDPLSVAVS